MSNKKKYIDYYELYGSLGCYHRPSLTPDQQKMYDWIMGEIDNAEVVDVVEVEKYIELREQYDKIFLAYHELRDNFISYVCSGVPNPSPFCLNKRKGCCNCYGWCLNNDKCKGFNPAEVVLDEERRTDERKADCVD